MLELEIGGEPPATPGVRRHWIADHFPLRSATGKITGLIGAVLEATERKQAGERLAASKPDLGHHSDLHPQVTWITDANGRFLELGPCWTEWTGQSREHTFAHGWSEFVHPEDREIMVGGWVRSIT